MNLYHNKNCIGPANKSDTFILFEEVGKLFEYFKKVAIDSIHENIPVIAKDQIKRLLTVPSVLDLPQKGVTIVACERVVLFKRHTDRGNFLNLEPEVASLYCTYDNSIDKNYLTTGKTYIACDLWGGICDIVTHCRISEINIIEKYKPIEGSYGSDEIKHEFFNKVL